MLIGITGDTHNNLKNISEICKIFNKLNLSLVIHTGDITLPKSLKAFSKLKTPLVGVFGNNDQFEKEELINESKKFDCKIFDEPHFLEINQKRIYILHHPELITKNMTENSDFVIHGHTHRYRSEFINNALIFNPGECAGHLKGKNNVGVIDTSTNTGQVISF